MGSMSQTKRPNFLIIMADDMGFSDLSCYGSEIQTPNIDKLAAEGLRWSDYHVAPACSPTRSMLLSGTDCHIAGLGVMHEHKSMDPDRWSGRGTEGYLNFDIAALPEVLADNGYWNCMAGKWHLGLRDDTIPSARGFHKSLGVLPGSCNHYAFEPSWEKVEQGQNFNASRVPRLYVEDGRKTMPKANTSNSADGWYSSTSYAKTMIDYFNNRTQEEKAQPFFAYLPFSAPHWPLQCLEADRLPYKGKYDEGPDVLRKKRLASLIKLGLVKPDVQPYPVVTKNYVEWDEMNPEDKKYNARAMEVYAGMIVGIDKAVGMVIDHLEQMGQLDNTVVMFMSDNGPEGGHMETKGVMTNFAKDLETYYDNSLENLGNHNSYCWYGPRWSSAASAPHRLYKSFSTEGGIRVPLVLRYPQWKGLAPGSINYAFATCMDVMPTLLELAGAKHPNAHPKSATDKEKYRDRMVYPMRGKSWAPHLSEKSGFKNEMSSIHGEEDPAVGWEIYNRAGLRWGKWKINHMQTDTLTGTGQWELYDLDSDQGEMKDLAKEMPEKLEQMIEKWKQYEVETGTMFGGHLAYGQRQPLPDPLPVGTDYVMDNMAWIELGIGKRLADEGKAIPSPRTVYA